MTPERFPVAVTFQCTPLSSRWISERWEPVAVLADADGADSSVPTRVATEESAARWRFGGHAIELHKSEAEGYFLNVSAPDPKVFVMWRTVDGAVMPPVEPRLVTVSYNEAARLLDGGEQVDAVPMPAEVRVWMTPFVDLHYKPEPKRKVRRNDPFAEGASGRGREPRR
jgi:hypothetical protein